MNIGFFDSGIGGITVLYEALKVLPDENYIYYADTENVPYGTKSKEEVKKHVFDAVEFIAQQGVKAVVVACNTATSVAVRELRTMYHFPIIGMEPAVKPAVKKNGDGQKRVLVLATELTLKEEKFKNLVQRVDSNHIVDYLPFPELVEFAEKLQFDENVVSPVIKTKLSEFDLDKYGTIVLGCTHFPFFKNALKIILPDNIDIIDGNAGTVKYLSHNLGELNRIHEGSGHITFYKSGVKVEDKEKLNQYNMLFEMLQEMDRN